MASFSQITADLSALADAATTANTSAGSAATAAGSAQTAASSAQADFATYTGSTTQANYDAASAAIVGSASSAAAAVDAALAYLSDAILAYRAAETAQLALILPDVSDPPPDAALRLMNGRAARILTAARATDNLVKELALPGRVSVRLPLADLHPTS